MKRSDAVRAAHGLKGQHNKVGMALESFERKKEHFKKPKGFKQNQRKSRKRKR